ncbi:MAG: OmpA family protein [Alphaproteobacteria bacterium]|nr:OmpA family protein [Alphaproteobacteria bacterium]
MKTLRNLILGLSVLALGGCTVFDSFSEVDALNSAQATGSPFTQALTAEYRTYANAELHDQFDYPDSLHFARKGVAAAAGETVLPEAVSDWNLEENQIQELSAARGRLLLAFDLGGREAAPSLAATAQARFDCWIENSEEKDPDADACKSQFLDAMNQLEGKLGPAPAAAPMDDSGMMRPVEALDTQPSTPMAPEDAVYLVFFNWDSSELGAAALNVLDAVKQEVGKNPPGTINIVGHADTSGSKDYNMRLSFRRATAVRDALAERGIPESIIKIEGRGEEELLVPTPDNIREPANRRANISFQ